MTDFKGKRKLPYYRNFAYFEILRYFHDNFRVKHKYDVARALGKEQSNVNRKCEELRERGFLEIHKGYYVLSPYGILLFEVSYHFFKGFCDYIELKDRCDLRYKQILKWTGVKK